MVEFRVHFKDTKQPMLCIHNVASIVDNDIDNRIVVETEEFLDNKIEYISITRSEVLYTSTVV